ncbi:MAG: glycerol-3-phosphate dehydrogenase/oxidase [Bryobacteraceae bacterium]
MQNAPRDRPDGHVRSNAPGIGKRRERSTLSLRREQLLEGIDAAPGEWDIVVVGGGATGLGTAVDAAARGYKTLLLEAHDFGKGTSSRSTKLVHGGVRYLQQGNIHLVLEALRERGRMLHNAPHLAHRRAFIIPAYALWELPFYGTGLTLYDLLAGRERLGRSRILSTAKVRESLPTLRQGGLKGGILYYDGQFDDARYAIALLRTLFDLGGVALNYVRVTGLLKHKDRVRGVLAEDTELASRFEIPAKVVINATGVFADELRRLDEPQTSPVVMVSQGTHVVLPRSFLPGESALMIPRTSDGRVLFAIPWHDCVLVGTTDDPVRHAEIEPRAMPEERQFLGAHIDRFLGRYPQPAEIRSVWSGQRPLVRRAGISRTAALSRDHTILISDAKLLTITGGKWTTYRKMAEDAIDRAATLAGLPEVRSQTAHLKLHGWIEEPQQHWIQGPHIDNVWDRVYGADLPALQKLGQEDPDLDQPLHPKLPFRRREVIWAARHEMATCVEDVLARRTRALFLNASASLEAAPITIRLLARELGKDVHWEQEQLMKYRQLAEGYLWT